MIAKDKRVIMGRTKSYKEHLLKRLKNPTEAALYLNAALEDEDPRIFLVALKNVTEAQGGMSKIAEEAHLNRQSLYRTLSNKGNPKLTSVISILSSLGMEIQIRPAV